MLKYKLKIVDVIDEAERTKTFYFEKPEGFTWEEGTHTHIGHVGFDEGEMPNKNWVRHMSIMTLPSENKIGITTRVTDSTSEFKDKLSKLNIGDELILFKLGSRMALRRCRRPVILLSMGVGIATMRPIILSFIKDKTDIPYLINANVDSSGDFIFKDELNKLEDDSYKNYWLNSREAFYKTLDKLLQRKNAVYYIVGSDDFIKDIIQLLISNGINNEDIIIDKKVEVREEYFKNEKL
jgi:hypothetical protein